MSVNSYSEAVTNGLVFYFDTNNIKSYRGPAITNITGSWGLTSGTGTGYYYVPGTDTVVIPGLGPTPVNISYVDVRNDYATSGQCCPNLMSYHGGSYVSVSPSTTYTYMILYKDNIGYTSTNYMYRYEFNSSGTYVSEAGVFSDSNRLSMGDGWYWAWGTFTTQSTTARLTLYSFYYNYSTTYIDRFSVAKVGLFQGTYTGMSPQLWPGVGETRSATQGLLDVAGNYTVDLTNVSYSSDGNINFNGTSTRITSNNAIFNKSNGQEITVGCWVKPARNAGQYQIIAENRTSDTSGYDWILYQHTTDGAISFHGSAQNKTSYIPTLNQWIYVANTVTSGGTSTLYINGIPVNNTTGYTYGNNTSPSLLCIGGNGNGTEVFLGDIKTVAIYNRALTQSEVLQNFNLMKGRFGL